MRKPSADTLFLGALSLATALLALPAWTGDYVYDDWLMRDNAKMDGWDDAAAVFGRSSADYLGENAAGHAGAVTYRPLSMLSLIVVQVLFPRAPLPHHLVSLALHLFCTWLLFRTLRTVSSSALARPLALVFALHPLGIEAYGWINGRSDALGALGVLGLALLLFSPPTRGRPWATCAGMFACTLLAAFAKETALVAVLGVLAASLLPPSSDAALPDWRVRLRALAPGLCAIALALTSRALALGDVRRTGLSLLGLPGLSLGLGRLLGLMLEAIWVPRPRTMENLGFALAQPLGALALALIALLLAALVALGLRGAWRSVLLIGTGVGMVLPSVVVRHTFWLGGDRYLYIPLALFALALAFVPGVGARAATWSTRAQGLLLTALALVLAPAIYLTAETYRSQTDHMLGMMRMRPSDPTGFLIGARWLWHRGQKQGAQQLLAGLPRSGLPPPVASQLATVLGEMGQTAEALAVVADMDVNHPDDPFVQLDVIAVQLDQGQVADAERGAARLRRSAGFCQGVRALIESHLRQPEFARAHGAEARAMLARQRCD